MKNGRKNQSGILQRFIKPAGEGTHNSQIRAIWTPNMCLLERRKTKQELNDSRFGIYERSITFEGPDVYSALVPIRGTILAEKIKAMCKDIVGHISGLVGGARRMKERSNNCIGKDVARMVLHLKVDAIGRLWLLYSSSIRLVEFPPIDRLSAWKGFHEEAEEHLPEPLNINDIIKLPATIKLNQNAAHNPSTDISNDFSFTSCPSCTNVEAEECFHPVPYKTIISHFERIMIINKRDLGEWPPDAEIIKAGGGVGFGSLSHIKGKKTEVEEQQNLYIKHLRIIPPMISCLHQQLKIEGYKRYRHDILFLNKECNVCEKCFLSFSKLASTSFQMVCPIRLDKKAKGIRFYDKEDNEHERDPKMKINKGKLINSKKFLSETEFLGRKFYKKRPNQNKSLWNTNQNSLQSCLPVMPDLPPSITKYSAIDDEGEEKKKEEDVFSSLVVQEIDLKLNDAIRNSLSYCASLRTEGKSHPLQHMLQSYSSLERSRNVTSTNITKKQRNPYEIPLKLINKSSFKLRKRDNDL